MQFNQAEQAVRLEDLNGLLWYCSTEQRPRPATSEGDGHGREVR
jgi:hypothetical protein